MAGVKKSISGKSKPKKTKLKNLSEDEDDFCGHISKSKKPKEGTKAHEKPHQTHKGKTPKKVKGPKMAKRPSDTEDGVGLAPSAKEEPGEKRGTKRKRQEEKDPPAVEGPSGVSVKQPLKQKKQKVKEEAVETHRNNKVKKERKVKVKKEEEEEAQPVTTKTKKTKEEMEEKRLMKIQKKEEEEKNRWRWWEEAKYEDGVKWRTLEHKGPYFPPKYQPLPRNVNFYYNGKAVRLSPAAEEVALFFGQMLDHEYSTKEVFRQNFFKDWRKEMTNEERKLIQDLDLCDFNELHAMHKARTEAKKNMSKEEKLVAKEANQRIVEEHGFCLLDGHRERIGNFKVEPPGLFRGRGEHPKQGTLKKRIRPEDVVINCSKDSGAPAPPAGHCWKEIRHDNTVTWLACWTENVQGSVKYVMLNANSKLKGEKDWEKYEVARRLKACVDSIRRQYQQDLKSKQMGARQRAVALYFIDKLALRAGNEKEEGETADTVGCCSLRVQHVTLHPRLDGQDWVLEFDFLGKDCIRYYNKVPVSKKVFQNVKLFMEGKEPGDDLFDRLNTAILNKHLSSLMPGLTAKVFRTYNASITLQQQLEELSDTSSNLAEKLLSYNRANRAVAVLCNHQRAAPKTFDQSMANLQSKIVGCREKLTLAKAELSDAKKEAKGKTDAKLQGLVDRKKKAVLRCEETLLRMELQATDKQENKQIALSTSKLNYLDPRISVAWCKNMEVPLDKIYNKTHRDKFAWAIDMTEDNFEF